MTSDEAPSLVLIITEAARPKSTAVTYSTSPYFGEVSADYRYLLNERIEDVKVCALLFIMALAQPISSLAALTADAYQGNSE
jgi:hypothetical protein